MRPATPAEIEAISRLAHRPEGQVLLKYLEENMEKLVAQLITSNDPHDVRLRQGGAIAVRELIKALKGS